MLKGNKGEWSEIYTLFKLLADKVLYPGDANLEKVKQAFYPILRILRSESNGNFEYSVQDAVIVVSGAKKIAIPIKDFKRNASLLLEEIRSSNQTTFSVPEVEQFMNEINCISLKASSSAKTDITLVVHDQRTNQQPVLGFSIKSQLGNPSTLLNAGKTTNFIYKIENLILDPQEVEEINAISSRSKIKDRIVSVLEKGGSFGFDRTEKKIFGNNLTLIDSLLPEIVARLIFKFYSSTVSSVRGLIDEIEKENPLNYDSSNDHQFYTYKTKRFLTDIALGMMPSQVWTGELDATGGYLVVREDGEIVCYHIYNRNEFEDYLVQNTRLETASSSRHDFGKIYYEGGSFFMKLNLQIRFLK